LGHFLNEGYVLLVAAKSMHRYSMRTDPTLSVACIILTSAFFSFAAATRVEGVPIPVWASGQKMSVIHLVAGTGMTPKKPTSEAPLATMPLPRDPQLAVQEEFEAAKAQGTREAYDLFIARHPESALVAEARRLRERSPSKR
jgi:hypothetical protein